MSPETPALFGESLGHADERLVRTTIAELARQLSEASAASRATVILFGALGGGDT
jgi:uroporphyrin-III C-methyltransferase